MKTLSLLQPWASLLIWSVKKYETRSWATRYRGQLAIHASARRMPRDIEEEFPGELIRLVLDLTAGRGIATLPLGAVLGTVVLRNVFGTGYDGALPVIRSGHLPFNVPPIEAACGNYEEGRFAWECGYPREFLNPVPAKGSLGLWDWEPPADLESLYIPSAPRRVS